MFGIMWQIPALVLEFIPYGGEKQTASMEQVTSSAPESIPLWYFFFKIIA